MNLLADINAVKTITELDPYQVFGKGLKVAFERGSSARDCSVGIRKSSVDELIVDGSGFDTGWIGLEIELGDNFKTLDLVLRIYPMEEVYPKLYYDGGQVELQKLQVSCVPFELRYRMKHLVQAGMPIDASNPRISIMLPNSEWFALGLIKAERQNG